MDPPVSFQVVSEFDFESEAEEKKKESGVNSLLEFRLAKRLAVLAPHFTVVYQTAGFLLLNPPH